MTTTIEEQSNDAERLERRRQIRAKIAQCQIAAQKADILLNQIRELDRRADQATADHQAVTQPAQQRLHEIEQAFARALADRTDVDQALIAERVEVMGTIAAANEKLQGEVDRLNKLKRPIHADEQQLRVQSAHQHFINELAKPPAGRPDLVAAMFSADQAVKWAKKRADAAEAQCEQWSRLAKESAARGERANVELYTARLERWRPELAVARKALGAAMDADRQAFQASVDE